MLARYKFVNSHRVNQLQVCMAEFMENIKKVDPTDDFDKQIHCPEALRPKIRKNSALETKIVAFFNKYKNLNSKRIVVYNCFVRMNEIQNLFNTKKRRRCIKDLPLTIQEETKDLFVHLYTYTLDSFGDIKDHYREFYKDQDGNTCPFCGLETLEHYIDTKEDYDHLLAKSIYPFAAINMENLAPMCKKCNRSHKKAKDLILLGSKHCKAINPYFDSKDVKVKFEGSILPTSNNEKGKWLIDFSPNIDEVKTWNNVFNMSGRIERDIFTGTNQPKFRDWLNDFIEDYGTRSEFQPYTVKSVREAMAHYANRKKNNRHKDQRYIKADLFRWMSKDATTRFIRNLIRMLESAA